MDYEKYTDFMIKLYRGAVISKDNPNFNNRRVEIEIYSNKLDEMEYSKIQIEGKDYNIKSQNLLNKIKNFIDKNLDTIINWSLHQNKFNLDNNAYEGGIGRNIKIKYGQLIINVNGQVRDIGELCDNFIDEIAKLIVKEENKTDEDYIVETLNNLEEKVIYNDEEKEFDKYCNLYEERFGRKAYIAEPTGTKEQTIKAIKMCLEKNVDILDKLLYPNENKFIY